MDTIASIIDTLLLHLAWTSIQASVLIGLLWLLGRALPRLPTPTRCLLWWLLGAQLLVGFAWQAPVRLPVLPPAHPTTTVLPTAQMVSANASTSSSISPIVHATMDSAGTNQALPWREALAALWLAGLLVQLAFVARQWERTRRIRHHSKPLDDPGLQALCADQARRLGLRRCPELRVSGAIDSPQVTGLWRPSVLLPARTTLTSAEQAMALAHELAHVRRGDLWLGWIPALAKGLFFFHPLVRLAVREYALHREAACDGQALRLQETAPRDYGHLLLHLGVAPPASAGLTSVASPSFQQLKRRLALLQHAASTMPRPRDWLLVTLIALAFVMPYRLVEAGGEARVTLHMARTSNIAFILPPPPPAPPSTVGVNGADSTRADATSDHRTCAVSADNIGFCGSHFLWYGRPAKPGQGVVFFDKRHVIIHGTHADVVAAKRFYNAGASALWFRRGSKAWITRDGNVIDRAWQIYAPALKRIEQRGRLTDEQSALAGKQSAIASQQAGFARKLASLARQRAALARKVATLAQRQISVAGQEITSRRESSDAPDKAASARIDAERKAISAQRRTLDRQRRALNEQHARLAKQHAQLEAKLDAQRHALAEQRDHLAKQRNALATQRKQAEADTHEAMQQLLDDALTKGLATPVSHD